MAENSKINAKSITTILILIAAIVAVWFILKKLVMLIAIALVGGGAYLYFTQPKFKTVIDNTFRRITGGSSSSPKKQ